MTLYPYPSLTVEQKAEMQAYITVKEGNDDAISISDDEDDGDVSNIDDDDDNLLQSDPSHSD